MSIDMLTGLVERQDPRPFPTGPATVAEILDAPLAEDPSRLALIDGDRTWTYSELDQAVNSTAAALTALNIGAGDRVGWSLANCAELPIGFLACQRLGVVWVGLNPKLASPERQLLIDDAEVSLVVESHPTLGTGTESLSLADLAPSSSGTAAAGAERPGTAINPHAPAAIAYTSGTTGRPRGVVHSQHNMLWQGLCSVDAYAVSPSERLGTPLGHTILNIMVLGPLSAFIRRTTSVILDRTDAAGFSADVKRSGLSYALAVPTMLHDLVHDADIDPAELATLQHLIVGGAGAGPDLRRRFHDRFGVKPIPSYGLTEAPSGVARGQLEGPVTDAPTCLALPPVELVVADDRGVPQPAGVEGEVCVRAAATGPWAGSWTPMLGYWRKPADTASALTNEMLHTGDVGTLDSDGHLSISGRKSDLIIRGGANIHPAEVERVLMSHPDVDLAAVIGVPDDRLGQRVVALVKGTRASIQSIAGHCTANLAKHKAPDEIVFVDSIPTNAMGKPLRRDLHSLARGGSATEPRDK